MESPIINERYGPIILWSLCVLIMLLPGVDPHNDTPVEILHTVLLGIIKYIWHHMHSSWKDTERDQFVVRFQAADDTALDIPPIRAAYMVQYRNGLVGKHFRAIMQLLVFQVHGLVKPEQFALIKAAGQLGSLLWIPEIHHLELYLVCNLLFAIYYCTCSNNIAQQDLEVVIGNVLDCFDAVDGGRIIDKIKVHMLVHLPDDIRQHGPAVRYETEVFECFNGVFRLCSVLSNRQSPSHDIARKFGKMERVKHIVSGGYWPVDQTWIRAGAGVRDVLMRHPVVQTNLGWAPKSPPIAGNSSLPPTFLC